MISQLNRIEQLRERVHLRTRKRDTPAPLRLVPSGHRRALLEQCCSAEEHRWLNACSADEYSDRLLELWTLKEAYVKATGEGLARRFDTLSFRLPASGTTFVQDIEGQAFHLALAAPTPKHRLAVALRLTSRASFEKSTGR